MGRKKKIESFDRLRISFDMDARFFIMVFVCLLVLFFIFYEKEGESMMDWCLAVHNASLKSDMVSRALRRAREESAISFPSFSFISGPEAFFITADIQISGWNTEKPAMAPLPRPTSQSHTASLPLFGRD